VDGLNAPVCLRVDAEERADMVLEGARCVTLTLSDVTEHVEDTPTHSRSRLVPTRPLLFLSSDATTTMDSRVSDTVCPDRN